MSKSAKPPQNLEEAIARIQELEGALASEQQGRRIEGIAVRHLKPNRVVYGMDDLRRHVNKLSPAELKKLDDKAVDKWFADYAKENADFAHGAPAGTAAGQGPGVASPAPAKPAAAPAARPRVPAGQGRSGPSVPHVPSYPTPKPKVTSKSSRKEVERVLGRKKPW